MITILLLPAIKTTTTTTTNNYWIDCSIYLNLSKSIQSAAWLKALKPAANGRWYLMCKSKPYIY